MNSGEAMVAVITSPEFITAKWEVRYRTNAVIRKEINVISRWICGMWK
jgi:hypothetical protein